MPGSTPNLVYACDPWEIDLGRRELRSRGTPVVLGQRAFEIVEALAQAGAVLVLSDSAHAGQIPFFARIDNCRFRQQVRPGDTLRLQMEVTSFRPPVGKGHASAFVEDKLVCEADLTFALGPAPT